MVKGLYKFAEKWSAAGSIWLYSDPHFGDEELRATMRRPSDEEMVALINKKIGKNETFVCLGDVGDAEFVKKIRGYKVLVCGNHDAGRTNYEGIFDEVYEGPLVIGEKLILSHEPLMVDWAFNIHGHTHTQKVDLPNHKCVCADVIDFKPVNLADIIKSGVIGKVESVHRKTIDRATKNSKRRNRKREQ